MVARYVRKRECSVSRVAFGRKDIAYPRNGCVNCTRRKGEAKKNDGKKKYRKKAKDTVRLCADDVMTRDNLKQFQDIYAEKMQKYLLSRGIKGSDARHISTPQYYRDLHAQNEELKESIEYLQDQKQEVYDSVRNLYDRKDEAREKFLNMHDHTQQKEIIIKLEIRIE